MMPTLDGSPADSLDTVTDDSIETGGDIQADNAAVDDTDDSSKDSVVDKRVNDTEAALKQMQKELHATAKELAETRGELKGLSANKQPDKETDWFDPASIAESIRVKMEDDPSLGVVAAMEHAVRGIRAEMVGLLELRDKHFFSQLEANKRQVAEQDPERIALQETITELMDEEWFASLDPKAQVQAAKKIAVKSTSQKVVAPGGLPSGRRTASPSASKARQKEIEDIRASVFGEIRKSNSGNVAVTIK